jgi:Tfp pilus assembly protein PilP/exonuclease VII small subunit
MKSLYRILSFLLLSATLAACGRQAATPDLNAQVQAAVAQTATAQTAIAQIAQTAIAQTATAQPTTTQTATAQPTAAETATAQPGGRALPPTPTSAPAVESYTLTEEELAGLIDQAVEEALAAGEQATAATAQATLDDVVTVDEVYAIASAVYEAEALVAYAQELMDDYYGLYGEYASAAVDTLVAIEEDLAGMETGLEQMASILEQGAEAASQAIQQLDEATAALAIALSEAQTNAQGWVDKVQAALQVREHSTASASPTEIAGDLDGAVQQVYAYLDAVQQALDDNKIGQSELTQIAQLAANAQASLERQGGPALRGLASSIDGLTRQLARGEWPQARNGLAGFETSLPQRPLPSGPRKP